MAQPFYRAPTSETCIRSLGFSAISFPAKPSDQVALKTCSDSKTQYGPVLTRATASGTLTAESEGTVTTKNTKQGGSAEAYAIARHIHMSANKARRVIDQIRGRSYEESLMILELMPYRACDPILKLIYSAAANASNNLGLDQANLIVSTAYVNEGVTRKKPRPQARGRAVAIRKRTCHITVVLKDSSL